jgi:Type VI secretion system, TssN
MSPLLTLIYIGIAILFGFMFVWQLIQNRGKKPDFMTAIQCFAIWSLAFLAGCMLIDSFKTQPEHLDWVLRLVFLTFGCISTWGVFKLEWAVRDRFDAEKDSFEIEFAFISVVSSISVLLFSVAPTWVNIATKAKMMELLPSEQIWDAGLCGILPFLIIKVGDWASQIPYRDVENRWAYPIEPLNYEFWEWHELMQVNFEISRSLRTEYQLFQKPLKYLMNPWILAPKAQQMGDIFRVLVQERRKRRDLSLIQDIGTEYRGQAPFWLLFRVKRIWYRPNTWSRKVRYVNPNLSVEENEIQQGDVIRVERMPHFAKTVRYQIPQKSLKINGLEDEGHTSIIKKEAQGDKLHGAQNELKPYRDNAPNPLDAPWIEPQQYGYDGINESVLYPKPIQKPKPIPPRPVQEEKTEFLPKMDTNDAPTEMIRPSTTQEDMDKTTLLPTKKPNISTGDDDKTTIIKKR